jgi:hypothetical protein
MSPPPKPTELIYLPDPSPVPALLAVGLALVVTGLFAWSPYSVIGGIIAIISLVAWIGSTRRDIAQLPISQHTDTAPIPLRKS